MAELYARVPNVSGAAINKQLTIEIWANAFRRQPQEEQAGKR